MRLGLAFVLGFVMTAMLTQAGCIPRAYSQFHGETKIVEQIEAPKQYVPVPTPKAQPVAKKPTWKDTAKQIGRAGVFTVGVNAIVFSVRIGLAFIGLPVF